MGCGERSFFFQLYPWWDTSRWKTVSQALVEPGSGEPISSLYLKWRLVPNPFALKLLVELGSGEPISFNCTLSVQH